jgi:hypothetical protein
MRSSRSWLWIHSRTRQDRERRFHQAPLVRAGTGATSSHGETRACLGRLATTLASTTGATKTSVRSLAPSSYLGKA